ncbi:MAG: SAM-dependent methyltransferase, partial [bacterium]
MKRDVPPDYLLRNRQAWDRLSAEYESPGRRAWQSVEPRWGIWGIPESALGVLPDVAGKDV